MQEPWATAALLAAFGLLLLLAGLASPGEASLRAVLEPADTKALYFVGRGDGSHAFSERYDDHVRAVNQYQRSQRRNGR